MGDAGHSDDGRRERGTVGPGHVPGDRRGGTRLDDAPDRGFFGTAVGVVTAPVATFRVIAAREPLRQALAVLVGVMVLNTAVLWSLALGAVAVREVHRLSAGRATAAVLSPILLFAALALVVAMSVVLLAVM